MKEIALHILDIAQNSVSANSRNIKIKIREVFKDNLLEIIISDDGKGIKPELLDKISDPFVTTRTTRKVGLGISLFKAGIECCNGSFSITSEIGKGTCIIATYSLSHIDRPPLGNISETILTLVICNPDINFIYSHKVNENHFLFDTNEIKKKIEGVSINHPDIISWIQEYLEESIHSLNGGA